MNQQIIKMVIGAAYIGPFTEYSWVTVLAVIGLAVIIVCVAYKAVFKRKAQEEEARILAQQAAERAPKPVQEANVEEKDSNGISKIVSKSETSFEEEVIAMPFKGRLMTLKEVTDPIFAESMMGEGFAIEPSDGHVVAPVTGKVVSITDNRHTITFRTPLGHMVMFHIGLDAAVLDGYYLGLSLKEGDEVHVGQDIGQVDLELFLKQGASTISPVVFTNLEKNEKVIIKEVGLVERGMTHLVSIEKDSRG